MTGTESLAQSLVEAARDAFPLQRWSPDLKDPDARETVGGLVRANADERARVVVAAVLVKLAEAVEESAEPGGALAVLDTYLLRDLADAIRESPCP